MKKLTPLLVYLSLIPLCVTIIAILFLLPEVVPLHVGFEGIDRYGSKFETLVVGGLLTVCCLLFTVSYHNIDKLNARGLVHGSVGTARVVLIASIIVFDILSVVTVLFFWMS
jgi:hypothetical protein